MVGGDAFVQKMAFEKLSQEVALAAAAKPGDNLDCTVMLGGDKLSKVVVAFDGHRTAAFVFVLNIMFCKAEKLYHNSRQKCACAFSFCAGVILLNFFNFPRHFSASSPEYGMEARNVRAASREGNRAVEVSARVVCSAFRQNRAKLCYTIP